MPAKGEVVSNSVSALYQRRYRVRRHELGGSTLFPASDIREHLNRLRRQGMGYPRIAECAGMDKAQVWRICSGRVENVEEHTYTALVRVHFSPSPNALISALGTHRRLQAMAWDGWPWAWIDQAGHMTDGQTEKVLRRDRIKASTAGLYRQVGLRLQAATPPMTTARERQAVIRARLKARREGWAPWAAWDYIDDPAEKPKGIRSDAA